VQLVTNKYILTYLYCMEGAEYQIDPKTYFAYEVSESFLSRQ